MTVSLQTPEAALVANGVANAFGFQFNIPTVDDLVVQLDGVVQTGGFTVSGLGLDSGGSVTFATVPADGVVVTIRRETALERLTDYQRRGDFPSPVVNEDFDRPIRALQEQAAALLRSLRVVVGATSSEIPSPQANPGRFLGVDGAGNFTFFDPLFETGFVAAGPGSVTRTFQDKLRENLSVQDKGAIGDGITDRPLSFINAIASLPAGGSLHIPGGIYLLSEDDALAIATPNITIYGDGPSTILKAKDGAALTAIVTVLSTAAGFSMRDLVLDGNRTGGGISPHFFGLNVTAPNCNFKNVEVRHTPGCAVFVGSSTAVPSSTVFETCWIHDNGGVTDSSGIGEGIQSGGAFLPNDMRIETCRFERNHNTVTLPGQSAALNLTATNVHVINSYFEDNFNVNGGQVALASNVSDGSADGGFVVTGNTVVLTGTFGGDQTSGIEIDGRKFDVSHNIIRNATASGIRAESSGGDGNIGPNIITCATAGVELIASGGTGIRRTKVAGNIILSGATGVSVASGSGVANVEVLANYIDASVTTKIAGPENCALIRGNTGYSPAVSTGLVAGTSPYTFPLLNYDAVYSCSAVAGMSAANVDGVSVSIAALIPIPVKAGHAFTTTWASTAPTFGIYPQQ